MASTPLTRAERFIYNQLAGSAALVADLGGVKIFNGEADQEATGRFVVFHNQSYGAIKRGVGGATLWTDVVYLVRVVMQTSDNADIENAAALIDQALNLTSGPSDTGFVHECFSIRAYEQSERESGRVFRHLGHFYRLYVS